MVFQDSISSIPITVVHTAHMSTCHLLVSGQCTSCEWYPISQMSCLNMMSGFSLATEDCGWPVMEAQEEECVQRTTDL